MNDTTFQGDGKAVYVPIVVNAKPKQITNADRIRAMTDEELAEWIISITEDDTPSRFDWLKEEVNT